MKIIHRYTTIILSLCFFILLPLLASAKPLPPLDAPPLGERWYSISLGDERAGFAHTVVSTASEGYEISCDGSVKMLVLGFSRQASSRETYRVNKDLSLRSFVVEQTLDGSLMRLTGVVTAKGVKVTVESKAGARDKVLKSRGAVYPPAVLNLLPLLRGTPPGGKLRAQMLDPEEVKVKDVTITVLKPETSPDGRETIHLRNDLY